MTADQIKAIDAMKLTDQSVSETLKSLAVNTNSIISLTPQTGTSNLPAVNTDSRHLEAREAEGYLVGNRQASVTF